MSDPKKFDPYLIWLGIRDPERPPNHYRLLGLEQFESDSNVIASAADRQMAHVRTHQAGAYGEDSQWLLNELMSAKICLLKSERKAEYDKVLRAKITASKNKETADSNQGNRSSVPSPVGVAQGNAGSEPSDFTDAIKIFGDPRTDSKVSNRRLTTPIRPIQKPKPYAMYGVMAGLVIVAIVVTIALVNSDGTKAEVTHPKTVATSTPKRNVTHPIPVEAVPVVPDQPAKPKTPTAQSPAKELVEQKPKTLPLVQKENPAPKQAFEQDPVAKQKPIEDPPIAKEDFQPKEPANGVESEKQQPQVAIIEPKIGLPKALKEDPEKPKIEKQKSNRRKIVAATRKKPPQVMRRAFPGGEETQQFEEEIELENRHPVPRAEVVAERRKKIRLNYKDDYARRDNPKVLESLAAKLLSLGNESQDDIPAMYAFYDEARTVAGSASDVRMMIDATYELAVHFDINPNKELLTTIGLILNIDDLKPETIAQLYVYYSDRLVKMLDDDDLEHLEPFFRAVTAINNRNVPVYKSRGEAILKDYLAEINDIKRQQLKIKKAFETLNQDPDNKIANTEIGRYLFFDRGRQMDAIPYLAKGTEGDLQKLAQEELTIGLDPTEIFTLAEKWWNSSLEKGNSEVRAQIKIHSCMLAVGVLNQLKALDKSEVESHLLDLEKDKYVVASDRSVQKIMTTLLTRGPYRVQWGPIAGSTVARPASSGSETQMTFLPNGKMNGDFINWEFARYWGGVVCWNHFQNGDRSVFDSRYLTSHSLITVSARGITIRRFNDLGKPERLGTGVLAAK